MNIDLSGAILFKNESECLLRAMTHVYPHVDKLVLVNDCSNDDSYNIAKNFSEMHDNVYLYNLPPMLSDRWGFGDKKNFMLSLCDSHWVYVHDADELVCDKFWKNIRTYINKLDIEVYALPRKNYIDDKFVKEAWPDYQLRLVRSYLRHIKPVHEEIVGFEEGRKIVIDPDEDIYILHKKSSSRQAEQNKRYANIKRKFEKQIKSFKGK